MQDAPVQGREGSGLFPRSLELRAGYTAAALQSLPMKRPSSSSQKAKARKSGVICPGMSCGQTAEGEPELPVNHVRGSKEMIKKDLSHVPGRRCPEETLCLILVVLGRGKPAESSRMSKVGTAARRRGVSERGCWVDIPESGEHSVSPISV